MVRELWRKHLKGLISPVSYWGHVVQLTLGSWVYYNRKLTLSQQVWSLAKSQHDMGLEGIIHPEPKKREAGGGAL